MKQHKPKTIFDRERQRAGLGFAALGRKLGVSREAARRYCLPANHPDHRNPFVREATRERVWAWVGDLLTIDNYAKPAPTANRRRRA